MPLPCTTPLISGAISDKTLYLDVFFILFYFIRPIYFLIFFHIPNVQPSFSQCPWGDTDALGWDPRGIRELTQNQSQQQYMQLVCHAKQATEWTAVNIQLNTRWQKDHFKYIRVFLSEYMNIQKRLIFKYWARLRKIWSDRTWLLFHSKPGFGRILDSLYAQAVWWCSRVRL